MPIRLLLMCAFLTWAKCQEDSGLELKMANVVYRHGDRSPMRTFPKELHKDFWKQGLGQLTEKGMMQEFQMGRFLKSRYLLRLINQTYMRKQVYCRSSDTDRTLMSAEAQLAGLYPPVRQGANISDIREWQKWQLVPIHTVPDDEDELLRPKYYNCPRYKELQRKSFSDPEYTKVAQEYKDFINTMSTNVGLSQPLTLETISEVYDVLFCQRAHNLSLPDWATPEILEKLDFLHNFHLAWPFNTPEKQRLTGGVILGEFIENMKGFVESPGDSEKLFIYSAHRSTLIGLLSALNLYSGVPPPYSTAFLMELYYSRASKQYYVRMFYRNDTSREPYEYFIDGCELKSCSFKDFTRKTASVVPVDYESECQNTAEGTSTKSCSSYEGLKAALAIFVLLSALFFIAFLVFYRRTRKGRSRVRLLNSQLDLK